MHYLNDETMEFLTPRMFLHSAERSMRQILISSGWYCDEYYRDYGIQLDRESIATQYIEQAGDIVSSYCIDYLDASIAKIDG